MNKLQQLVVDYCQNNGVDVERIHLVLNNCRIHDSMEMQEFWDQCSFVADVLPPYTPVLNAIEEYWAQMKSWTRITFLANGETYVQRLESVCARVTQENCLSYVLDTKYFWLQCINKEDIIN